MDPSDSLPITTRTTTFDLEATAVLQINASSFYEAESQATCDHDVASVRNEYLHLPATEIQGLLVSTT